MRARIYRPARNAMQSGTARSKNWVLDFGHAEERKADPLMGWTGSSDTQAQVKMSFETRDEAEAYAKAHAIDFIVIEPKSRAANVRAGGYGENFATNRRQVWTH